jgi:UDP-N-acetylmuramate dehydrogenase
MDETLQIESDVPLAPRTTLGVGGTAELFCAVDSEAAVIDALDFARLHELPVALLGLVLHVAPRGVARRDDGERVLLTVAAGEPWDEVVARAVDDGLAGLEALSGIPGLSGATPIQNVGAYGQEVADTIVSVRVIDLRSSEVWELPAASCGFAYRSSVFKRAQLGVYVVVAVTFALRRGLAEPARYGELSRALGSATPATLARVRETVLDLRRAKSMVLSPSAADRDENARSAGSFFTNPIVSADVATRVVETALRENLARRADDVPRWAEPDGRTKLAAGWLVEQSGFQKGTRRGAVGLSTRHALALVCHEGATASALLAFADEVRDAVQARFGVVLEREPVVFGP